MDTAKKYWRAIYPTLLYLVWLTASAYLIQYCILGWCAAGTPDEVLVGDLFKQFDEIMTANSALIYCAVCFPAIVLCWRWFYKDSARRRELLPSPWRPSLLFILPTAFFACLFFNFLLTVSPLPDIFPLPENPSGGILWQDLVITVIAAPFAEELVCRASGFKRLREVCGFWPAAVISSVLFAVLHMNVSQGVYAFCLGMLLAWVYERFGTLAAPIVFHMAANLTSVLFLDLLPGEFLTSWILPLLLVSGILLVIFIWLVLRSTNRQQAAGYLYRSRF